MSRKRTPRRYVGLRELGGRTYRVFRYDHGEEALSVARRTHPRQNSFDQSYMKGRFPMWIRNVGGRQAMFEEGTIDHGSASKRSTRRGEEGRTWDENGNAEARPLFGRQRPAAEEPYVEALAEFFETRIALMPPKPRQLLQDVKDRLNAVMFDRRSFEDQAQDLGVTKQAVQQAQARAVEQLVESCGGKAALAEKLREFLAAKEAADGKDRLKYLPRWVHG